MNMHDEEFQVRVVTSSSSDHHVGLSSSIAITCGHPGNPAHGLTNGSEFNLNDVVNFTCSPGYLLQGASRAQCRSNGQWSSPLPTCRGRRVPSQQGRSHTRGPICLLGGLLHTLSMWWDKYFWGWCANLSMVSGLWPDIQSQNPGTSCFKDFFHLSFSSFRHSFISTTYIPHLWSLRF